MKLLILFVEFFRIGLFSTGGGLATLPFLYKLAENADWLTAETVGNIQAMAQSSPGAIGVNMSAQVGFQYAGIPGALIAPLGLIAPSILIILIIARMLERFKASSVAGAVFSGLRPAAAGLLAAAGFNALKLSLYNPPARVFYELLKWREVLIFGALFLLVYKFKKHPILYIAAGGAAGILLGL
jgi:chromate transporter